MAWILRVSGEVQQVIADLQEITLEGKVEPLPEPRTGGLTLEEMQAIVGGLIEVVRLTNNGYAIVVNEEGLPLELETNSIASLIARQQLVGDALVVRILDAGTEDERFV